ncbi:hypothetical protein F7734_07850 [Scytonema sp. UIC 10036]|uniref:hypothetical protein n=1 Tax=Scytonema sp. UIC 10036 TaxID=2304196 RepID=UPI0012DAA5F0|nr:hypothetical protein [Scytonema sp. UIC 10036]MUG92371.1 hypothetical protein [Scytonema sp. UIC 10036]
MFQIAWFSAKLFFKGKLFRDPVYFIKQIAIATIIGSLVLVSLALIKLPLLLAVATSSLLTGIMMPFLFKDFKMQ